MAINIKEIEERLAKAKEEAEFWEKARAVLADPRLKAMSSAEPESANNSFHVANMPGPRAYGELRQVVHAVLPDADANISTRVTTPQIVSMLTRQGYVFNAKDPMVAVNGALVALEERGTAEWSGKRGNAKLWRKKQTRIQEAPERAS